MARNIALYYNEKASDCPCNHHSLSSMWRIARAAMSDRKNATFADHDAATFDVSESLSICKQLLEHSWKQYNNEHYHLVWQDALDTAIEGCKGLLTLSTEKHVQDLEKEKHMWFVLFLTFTGISLTAVCALLYFISTMRTFVSLRKCLVSTWESRETRPNPQSLLTAIQSPLSTRPMVSNWAKPDSPQKQTPAPSSGSTCGPSQGQTGPYIPNQVNYPHQSPGGYPVTIMSNSAQPCMGQGETKVTVKVEEDEPDNKAELLANIEEKFKEYQRSLWDLQRAGMPGLPPGLYPSISHGHLATHGEGEP